MWGIVATIVVIAVLGSLIATLIPSIKDKRLVLGVCAVTALVLIQAVFVAADVKTIEKPNWSDTWRVANFGFAILIGLLVGATELISRYRDQPFAPLLSVPGALYVVINGGASALAYYLLSILNPAMDEPLRTFTAGISAMVFFRSALFNVRLSGADVPVGPNLILLTILKALDRTYDRERAAPRSLTARRIVGNLSFEQIRQALPALCFDLMQNLSPDETAAIKNQVNDLAQSTGMDDRSKTLSLGLALLNLVGETTLQAAVNTLGSAVKTFRPVDAKLLGKLATAQPQVVLDTLPNICASLNQATLYDTSAPALALAPPPESLSTEAKVVLIVYQLVNYYGDQLVSVAATLLGSAAAQRNAEEPVPEQPAPEQPVPEQPVPEEPPPEQPDPEGKTDEEPDEPAPDSSPAPGSATEEPEPGDRDPDKPTD
jgi:hypothetical protein